MAHSPRFQNIVNDHRAAVTEITPQEVLVKQQRGDEFVLIDIREDSEFAAGSIKGAVHLGKGVIERDIEKSISETDKEIVLYCAGGFRSVLAASALQQMGYTNVKSMSGGWRGWNALEYPTQ